MELMILISCLLVAVSCLLVNLLIAYLLWKHLHDKGRESYAAQEETPEEKEARRLAAKAQAEYEQGFINLMNYGGILPKGV